ncbi:MAG: PKD domain-containing protein, partial [Bacteroidia bacterium]
MKNKLILLFLVLFFHFITNGQNNNGLAIKQFDGTPALSRADSLNGFDEIDIREHAAHAGKKGADADLFVEQAKRNYIERKYGLDRPSLDLLLRGASNSSTALNCATDNFNFEQGSAAGWTLSGNCGLMSSGTDPYGGFPNVCPLSGGGTSLKLSSDLYSGCCNSSAIKSIPVPAGGTTFFTFYFAVAIFNYPHLASAAAKFSVDFYDQSGALIPCPQFLVYHSTDNGDVGVNNFQSTPNPALYYNSAGAGDQTYNSNVTYAPWQAVTADLTPYAGTTISAVFTVKWCVPQVDWLYAIIDADCPINYIPPSSTCVTLPYNLCGPPNMQTYTWTAPGGATSNASCVNATTAGTYTVKCTPKLDCGNAVFTYTYNVQPIPTANFTPNLPTCANNLTATDNSTLHGATVASYSWDYGDGSSGTGNPTTHSYPTVPGTYNITETVTTTQGCSASVTHPVTVTNPLVLTVNSSSVCPGYSTVLTATGGASSYTWSPGTNLSGTNVATVTANPSSTTIYTVTGSNGSCTNTATSTVTVAPAVVPAPANNSPLCEGQTLNLTSGGGTSYSWNGPNSFSSTSQNPSITGVNASAAGVYTVTVTDANGCQGTGTTTVTISPSVTPAATGTTVCTGAAIDLTSSGGVTYSWSGPNNFTSSAQNPSIAGSTTAMTGVYSVTVTNGPGCVGVTTANVTVNPLPIVTVSGSTVCANATINLTSSGGTSYSWTGPSAYSSTSQNPSITNATTAMSGTYSVTVTDANGCVSGNNTNVTVNPLPIVTASGSTVCANATINLTSNGGTSYSWTGPSAYSSTSQNPSIVNATTAMSGTYSVTVTDANGCVNGNSTDVTVNPLPIVTAGGSTVCANATINLTSSGGTSYSWTGPSAYTSTLQNPSIANATTAMSGTYSVTVTDANGCVNGNSTDVTVNPNPIPTASNNSPLCVNQTLNFTGGGGTNYSWSGPNGFTSPSQNPLIANVTTAEAGTYVLVVTDANGCQAITTTTVVVNPLPIVTANGSTVCTNATIDLTSGGGTGYTWNGPGGFTSNIQNPSIPNAQPSMSGTYTVTVTDVNGCVNTNTTNVTVNLSVIVTAGSNTPCQGFPLDLTSNGGISWSWNGPGGFTSNMQNPTLASATTAMDGTYSVTATDINGCVGSATINITVNP